MLRIVPPLEDEPPKVEAVETHFACKVCGHKVTVYNDGEGVTAWCWHRGTKFHNGKRRNMVKVR